MLFCFLIANYKVECVSICFLICICPCLNSLFAPIAHILIEILVFHIYINLLLNSVFTPFVCLCFFPNVAPPYLPAVWTAACPAAADHSSVADSPLPGDEQLDVYFYYYAFYNLVLFNLYEVNFPPLFSKLFYSHKVPGNGEFPDLTSFLMTTRQEQW